MWPADSWDITRQLVGTSLSMWGGFMGYYSTRFMVIVLLSTAESLTMLMIFSKYISVGIFTA